MIAYKYSRWFLIAGVFILCLQACSKAIDDQSIINTGQTIDLSTNKQPLKINFAGVASFTLHYKNSIVLTDPFVSNPPLGKVLFGSLDIDTAAVNQYYDTSQLDMVKMVVVGHGHYDHVMDLPYLMNYLPTQAKILCNQTTQYELVPLQAEQEIAAMNTQMGSYTTIGVWNYSTDSSVRVMAFESSHPAHLLGYTFAKGPLTENLTTLPNSASTWEMGKPLTFLIDFMDSTSIAWRVFAQSSSATGTMGLFPPELLKEKPIDVVLVGIAMEDNAAYPLSVIEYTNAPVSFLSHWENFLLPKVKPYKSVAKSDVSKSYNTIRTEIDSSRFVILPEPGSQYILR